MCLLEKGLAGQTAALERDEQAGVLQGSWGIPVVGQPDVTVWGGYPGEYHSCQAQGMQRGR